MAKGAIDTGGGNFEALVLGAIDLQRKLQLARDFLAVFHRHELIKRWSHRIDRRLHPRQVDGHTQQTARGALNLHQVIPEADNGLFYDLLQRHVIQFNPGKTKNPITPGDFPDSFELEKQSTKKNGRLVPARLVVRLLL
jgi:hypothetical protein